MIARIIAGIAGEQDITRRRGPMGCGVLEKILDCLRTMGAKAELIVNVFDIGDLNEQTLRLSLRDQG